MGAGALAGTTFAVNRERLAKDLGFARVARNSLDVTSRPRSRGGAAFRLLLCMVHLSRWAEDLHHLLLAGIWLSWSLPTPIPPAAV